MAKKPTKPAKPAPKGGAKKPAKAAAPAKPKKAAAVKSSKKPAAAVAKPSAKPSSKSAGPKKPAKKVNPSPIVNKNSSKPAGKAPAAKAPKSPPVPAKNGSTVKKPKPEAGKTDSKSHSGAPPAKVPSVIRRLNPDDVPEIVIPKKSPFAATFLKKQKQRLMDLRSTLLDSMEGVAKDSLRTRPEGSEASVGGMHMGDAGSDAYDRDFALSLLSKEQDALYEITEALKRIEQGSYGICEMTGKTISEERLEALPFARYTREAQESIERDQQGGRNRKIPVRSVFGLDDEENEDDEEEEESGSSSKQSGGTESLDFMKE